MLSVVYSMPCPKAETATRGLGAHVGGGEAGEAKAGEASDCHNPPSPSGFSPVDEWPTSSRSPSADPRCRYIRSGYRRKVSEPLPRTYISTWGRQAARRIALPQLVAGVKTNLPDSSGVISSPVPQMLLLLAVQRWVHEIHASTYMMVRARPYTRGGGFPRANPPSPCPVRPCVLTVFPPSPPRTYTSQAQAESPPGVQPTPSQTLEVFTEMHNTGVEDRENDRSNIWGSPPGLARPGGDGA